MPGLVWWHTPSGMMAGGKRTKSGVPLQILHFKRMGWRPGVADLILVHKGRIHALELKAPGGRASVAQMEFLSEIDAAGAYTAMPEGVDAALATLGAWGLIR